MLRNTSRCVFVRSSSLSAQTLSPAQWARYSIPLRILQAATYEDLENAREARYADLSTPHTSTPQSTYFVDAFCALTLYLICLVLSNLYTLFNSHPEKLSTTPQNLSGPQRSQPQARHSQTFAKKDKRRQIRCLPSLATTPIWDKRKRTSKRTLQLLL